jgi:hypothetical protein
MYGVLLLTANVTEIKSRITQGKPTVIIVQEKWLRETLSCKIPGNDVRIDRALYYYYRRDETTKKEANEL